MDFSTREALIEANSELILSLKNRLKAKRFKPQEADGIKISYMRLLIQALQCQNTVLKDFEIDELRKEIEELKENLKCQ